MLNPETFQKVDRVSTAFRTDLEQLKTEQFEIGEVPLYAVNGGGITGQAGYWVLTSRRVFHVTFQPPDRAFKQIGDGHSYTYLPPSEVTRPLKVTSRDVREVRLSDLNSVTRTDHVFKVGILSPPVKMIGLAGKGSGGGCGNGFQGLLEYDDGLEMYRLLQGVLSKDREKPTGEQILAAIRNLVQRRARGEMTDAEFASEVEHLV